MGDDFLIKAAEDPVHLGREPGTRLAQLEKRIRGLEVAVANYTSLNNLMSQVEGLTQALEAEQRQTQELDQALGAEQRLHAEMSAELDRANQLNAALVKEITQLRMSRDGNWVHDCGRECCDPDCKYCHEEEH